MKYDKYSDWIYIIFLVKIIPCFALSHFVTMLNSTNVMISQIVIYGIGIVCAIIYWITYRLLALSILPTITLLIFTSENLLLFQRMMGHFGINNYFKISRTIEIFFVVFIGMLFIPIISLIGYIVNPIGVTVFNIIGILIVIFIKGDNSSQIEQMNVQPIMT